MKSHPPAIVEVTRNTRVESTHEVDMVICDCAGNIVQSRGEVERIIFPRSAIKSLQALPMVESGAVDALGLTSKHLALCCASHNGEPMHVTGAGEIIGLAGLETSCLECGAQLPRFSEDRMRLGKEGPQAIHNNCSGKHAGFLAFASHAGFEPQGYIDVDHPVQRRNNRRAGSDYRCPPHP